MSGNTSRNWSRLATGGGTTTTTTTTTPETGNSVAVATVGPSSLSLGHAPRQPPPHSLQHPYQRHEDEDEEDEDEDDYLPLLLGYSSEANSRRGSRDGDSSGAQLQQGQNQQLQDGGPVVVRREPSAVKVCVDLDNSPVSPWSRPPLPPKGHESPPPQLPPRSSDNATLPTQHPPHHPLPPPPPHAPKPSPRPSLRFGSSDRSPHTPTPGFGDAHVTPATGAAWGHHAFGPPTDVDSPSSARMRLKAPRDAMSIRSEALRYWRSIHNKYSIMNGINRQRRNAVAKKQRQRAKDRNAMSIFFVLIFLVVFIIILVAEVFFIDEHRTGIIFTGKRPLDYESIADIPDYFMDDKKVIGELAIDAYRRQELSVKGKGGNKDGAFVRKNVDETHLTARVTRNLVKAVRGKEKVDSWLNIFGSRTYVDYQDSNTTARDATWQPVYNTKHKFFVYSAYMDDRKGRIIRVVGATQTKRSDRVWCKFWYSNSSTLTVAAAVKIIRENWNLRYSACFVACPLTLFRNGKQPIPPPDSVSIVSDPNGNATNKLRVLNLDVKKDEVKNGFAVCVKPLHFEYNNVNQIVEFLELNKILGVEHFTLYNDTIGPGVQCVLEQYKDQGLVSVLPWKLDMQSQKEIRTEGLFAALNDCLYRYMYQYRYVLLIDLDEFIVPHANASLPELVAFLNTKADPRKVGAISFQNAFFYLQWPDDPSSASLPPLVTLRKTRRRQRFHPHKQRSKYIAVTPYVVEAGNHFVWEFLPGRGTLNVPNEVAFLHHYRVCEFGGDDCVRNPRTTDSTTYRYKDQLVQAFTSKLSFLREVCSIPPEVTTTARKEEKPPAAAPGAAAAAAWMLG
ncbi:uncharacterized protein LOC143034837 [Oratosquilla oratoria]|uniref:uncharacterized protein LOC143034837 n=1 Tax=Oratosquilla oratoria TaxID=337810 RepID=UPI003F75FDC7